MSVPRFRRGCGSSERAGSADARDLPPAWKPRPPGLAPTAPASTRVRLVPRPGQRRHRLRVGSQRRAGERPCRAALLQWLYAADAIGFNRPIDAFLTRKWAPYDGEVFAPKDADAASLSSLWPVCVPRSDLFFVTEIENRYLNLGRHPEDPEESGLDSAVGVRGLEVWQWVETSPTESRPTSMISPRVSCLHRDASRASPSAAAFARAQVGRRPTPGVNQ
jgi:hypothetical protein